MRGCQQVKQLPRLLRLEHVSRTFRAISPNNSGSTASIAAKSSWHRCARVVCPPRRPLCSLSITRNAARVRFFTMLIRSLSGAFGATLSPRLPFLSFPISRRKGCWWRRRSGRRRLHPLHTVENHLRESLHSFFDRQRFLRSGVGGSFVSTAASLTFGGTNLRHLAS